MNVTAFVVVLCVMSEKGVDSLFDYTPKTCFRACFTKISARQRVRECGCYSMFRLCGTGSKHRPGTRMVM
jgi:NADPH-dependent curcumin reductase CurA